MKAARILRPSSVRTGMFCRLGSVEASRPVEVAAILAAFDENDGGAYKESPGTAPLSVDRLEWEHIQRILHENEGNISATARALKMHRRTLQRKLAKRPVKA